MPRFHAKCKFPSYAILISKSLGALFAGLLLSMKIHNFSSEDPVIQFWLQEYKAKYERTLNKEFIDILCV